MKYAEMRIQRKRSGGKNAKMQNKQNLNYQK